MIMRGMSESYPSTSRFGDAWPKPFRPAVLQHPSAIIPGASTYPFTPLTRISNPSPP